MHKRKTFLFLALAALLMACNLTNGGTIGAAVLSRATHSPQSNPPTPTIPTSTPRPHCTVDTGTPGGALNLRSCPGMSCGVLAVLDEGDDLTILAAGDWIEVQPDKGAAGFVNSSYCKIGE